MKRVLIVLIVVLSAGAMLVVGNAVRTSAAISALLDQQIPKESKEQPKKLKLGTDSLDDKWGEIAFDHENHTIKNYSPDGKTTGTCVECHHTDQPKEKLTPPLVTSERNVVLTADVLKTADPSHGRAVFAKNCATCHILFGEGSKLGPLGIDQEASAPSISSRRS